MNTDIHFLVSLNPHLTFNTNFFISNSIFHHLTYSDVSMPHGGAIYMSNSDAVAMIVECSFFNNTASSEKSEGGSIFINQSKKVTLNCSLFDHNSAFWSCSFWISDRNKAFPLASCQISISNSMKYLQSTHLEILGGNPLNLININISHNELPSNGLIIDYIQDGDRNSMYHIIYAECTLGSGYFLHDQNFPGKYYCCRSVFINNDIEDYFGKTSIYEMSPTFINCDLIFDIKIPTFNRNMTFLNCYFSTSITYSFSATFINTLTANNGILQEYQVYICSTYRQVMSYNHFSINMKCYMLTSIFLLS